MSETVKCEGGCVACTGDVVEPTTPSRSRSRSPDIAKVQHADILGHYDELTNAGKLIPY